MKLNICECLSQDLFTVWNLKKICCSECLCSIYGKINYIFTFTFPTRVIKQAGFKNSLHNADDSLAYIVSRNVKEELKGIEYFAL